MTKVVTHKFIKTKKENNKTKNQIKNCVRVIPTKNGS